MTKTLRVALALGVIAGGCSGDSGFSIPGSSGSGSTATGPQGSRVLVLSAFPGEIAKILAETTVSETIVIDGRSYLVGTLTGHDVVLALTGIGLVNAEKTTRDAVGRFPLDGIVFSGVAGSQRRIGDVTVPARWKEADSDSWIPVSAEMLRVAREVAPAAVSELNPCTALGDIACLGLDPSLITTVCLNQAPQIFPGGDGLSSDPFGGKAFPCIPLGGDVFGCEACRAPESRPPDLVTFAEGVSTLLDPELFQRFSESTTSPPGFDSVDMETAAVARVAREQGIPFLGFRGVSDGPGDPLMLPGFPVQFFVYRQIAADNAATLALAFLEAWRNP